LSRLDSRKKSGLEDYSIILNGRDFWTSYEVSWLNERGMPQNKILNISYSSDSKFFVESKSLKLYLYSLNNEKFDCLESIQDLIKKDLEEALKTEVEVELNQNPRDIEGEWSSLDQLEIEQIDSHPNSLVIEPDDQEKNN
jgi:7-cyano-7-deazaguanine reductase